MAEISIPYLNRKLARPSPAGRGGGGGGRGGGGGVVAQPRLPDVSGMYAPMRELGEEISQTGEYLGRVAAQQRKARDIATLTEFETGFDEAIGIRAIELKSNANVHPDDYYPMLAQYREDLFKERSQGLRGDLQPLAKAKAYKGTERTMIDIKADGAALGIKRALGVLDVYEDHIAGKMLTEGNEGQYRLLQDQLRQKYTEYQEAGYLSADDRFIREHKAGQRLLEAGVTMDAQQDGKGTLAALMKGEYAGLSPESRVKLIDKAQAERRGQAEWQDAEDRRAEKAVAVQQNERESQLREQIYKSGGGAGMLSMLSLARQSREIGPDQHDRLMSFAINLQTQRENQAAARASRAASAAARNEIAQRRADENQAGKLIALRNAEAPGADGQVVTDETIIGMAASGKLNWSVAGRVSEQASVHKRLMENEGDSAKKQSIGIAMDNAKSMFEMHSTRPNRSSIIDQAWSGFQNEFNDMVWKQGVDPQKALETLAPKYIAQAEDLVTVRTQVLNGVLPTLYQAPIEQGYAGLEAAKKQIKEDLELQAISLEDARAHARTLKEFESYAPYKKPATKTTTPTSTTPTATPQGEPFLERLRKNMMGGTGPLGGLRNRGAR